MAFPFMPDPIGDRERERARWHPERKTLELTRSAPFTLISVVVACDPSLFLGDNTGPMGDNGRA